MPLTESYSEAAALTHLSGNILLLTDIDQNLYQITTNGVVTFVGAMDHVAKGLAFVNAPVTSLLAAMLPSSRSVQVGYLPPPLLRSSMPVRVHGHRLCTNFCNTSLPADFSYQTTDPATNQVTGSSKHTVNIGAGATQSFVISADPHSPILHRPMCNLTYGLCEQPAPAPNFVGLNTLLLSASATPVPDIVALAATLTNDGIVNIPGD